MAAALVRASPEGVDQVLRNLMSSLVGRTQLRIGPSGEITAKLYFENGVIRSSWHWTGEITFNDCEITIFGWNAAEAVLCALPGRRLDEVIDLPIRCPVRIRDVSNGQNMPVYLHLFGTAFAVDFSSRTIGEEPLSGQLKGFPEHKSRPETSRGCCRTRVGTPRSPRCDHQP